MADVDDARLHELIDGLVAAGSCAVSDALDALGVAGGGVLDGVGPMWASGRVAGRVVTVTLAPASSGQPSTRHLGTAAIAIAGPTDVIVVDNGGRPTVSGWGGLLSLGATARGVRGVVVHGACRDIEEAEELKLPLFALAATARTARGRVVEVATGDPLDLDGVAVAPGDLVVADRSAVVFVPLADAEAVLARATEIAERERRMAEQIGSGVPAEEVLDGRYEQMLTGGVGEGDAEGDGDG